MRSCLTTVRNFQFLIKGYRRCVAATRGRSDRFQFLIKGYTIWDIGESHDAGTFNSSLKDTRLHAVCGNPTFVKLSIPH